MRKILSILLGICALSACGVKPGTSEYLSANVKVYSQSDVAQFVEMQTIPRTDALDSLRMLQKSMATSYIGYNIKKELIGKSGDEIFSDCLKIAENGPDRINTFKLYDYVRLCISGFQDSHLSMTPLSRPGTIATGIATATVIDGKVYITSYRTALLKKIEEIYKLEPESLARKLALGNEIVSVDGVPALQAVSELQKYVGRSSPRAAMEEAASLMFTRAFHYPEKNELVLHVRSSGDGEIFQVTLPWVLHTWRLSSLETRSALAGKGIDPMEKLYGTDKDLMYVKDFDYAESLFDSLQAKRTFTDSEDTTAMVFGLTNINSKTHCYMQLNTFMLDFSSELGGYKLKEKVNEKTLEVSFNENVSLFLKSCEMFNAPLILDLRENGGGDPTVAEVLYEYFETAQTPKTYRVVNVLNNTGNLAYLSNNADQADKATGNLEALLMLQALRNSFEKKTPVSDWMALKKTGDKSIFSGKLTVLTSQNCVSSCDGFANRVKTSGRGKIFGVHTNGTGFGFATTRDSTNDFQDHLKLYIVKLPNRSFQNILVESDKDFQIEADLKGSIIPYEKVKIIENRPTQPDSVIEYSVKDVKEHFADYIAKLSQLLEPPAAN